MKAVGAARRQAGQHGKQNLRQHPVPCTKTDSDLKPARRVASCNRSSKRLINDSLQEVDQWPDSASSPWTTDPTETESLGKPSPPMPSSGLELFILDHNVSPTDLSALTSIHVGAVASYVLADGAAKLKQLLSFRQWSYFEHLYSRYGHSDCLDDAIRALIVKAQALLVPSAKTSDAMVLSHYGTALNSLQAAFSDAARWSDPDTLCATTILALFDVSRALIFKVIAL